MGTKEDALAVGIPVVGPSSWSEDQATPILRWSKTGKLQQQWAVKKRTENGNFFYGEWRDVPTEQ